jgi:hypothetical protein
MYWTKLNFGKHKGLTLPQVILKDADWFFYAYENSYGTKIQLDSVKSGSYRRHCAILAQVLPASIPMPGHPPKFEIS